MEGGLPAMVVAAALLAATATAEVPEWSCWRGPAGDGHFAHETGWSWEWGEGGPGELWRAEVGIGYAGAVVSEGRVYTAGHVGKEDVVYCLDEQSGKKLWTAGYAQKVLDRYHPGGPGSTPAVEGEWLYVISPEGLVSCFSKAEGALRWRTNIVEAANARVPIWGFSSAPVIIGDRLFVNANRSGVALDKSSGKVIWASERAMCGYATPVPLRCRERDSLAILTGDGLVVVGQEGGKVAWEVAWNTKWGENSPDPLVIGDKIYVSTWWDMGAALFDPQEDEVEPVWKSLEMQNHIAASVLVDGCLFGFDGPVHRKKDPGVMRCVDAANGKTLWSKEGMMGSVLVSRGKLLILTNDGQLVVADASRDGYVERARTGGLGKRTWTPPTLHRGKLYVRDGDGVLVCAELRKRGG